MTASWSGVVKALKQSAESLMRRHRVISSLRRKRRVCHQKPVGFTSLASLKIPALSFDEEDDDDDIDDAVDKMSSAEVMAACNRLLAEGWGSPTKSAP